MKLNFVVPGFSKCGTTTLCSLLAEHPEIYLPSLKEPGFFAQAYECGWEWYTGLFPGADAKQVVGEGSTTYSTNEFAELACSRLVEHFPQIRVIFIARDPISRLESSYRFLHHEGHWLYGIDPPYTLRETLEAYPNLIEDTLYWKQINAYRCRIPDERIHVLFLEDFSRHPGRDLAKCFEFLGVDPAVQVENVARTLNSRSRLRYDSPTLRYLRTFRHWSAMSREAQSWLEETLRLRKPFNQPVTWDTATLNSVLERIADDARAFLDFYGKPADFWALTPTCDVARRAA